MNGRAIVGGSAFLPNIVDWDAILRQELFCAAGIAMEVNLPTAVLYGWLQSLMPNGILPCGALAKV